MPRAGAQVVIRRGASRDENPTGQRVRILIRDGSAVLSGVIGGGNCTMALHLTLLDVVRTVSEYATSDTEVVAIVIHLVNSGRVQLCGNFRGRRFDIESVAVAARAA